jgi:hypothetical protein
MWRWPIEIRLGGDSVAPPAPPPADRPNSYIGFFSDLSKNPKEARTFLFFIGGILVMFTSCAVVMILVVAFAAKGIKGVPLHYIWPIGIGGASLLTLAASLITTWIRRRLARALQASAEGAHKQDGKQLRADSHVRCLRSLRQILLPQPTALASVTHAS